MSLVEVEEVPLARIAEAVGTPTWVYSAGALRRRARALRAALDGAGLRASIHYAVKANGNLAVLRVLAAEGLGTAVVTDPADAKTRQPAGSYGWGGIYGTQFWVDPQNRVVGVVMTQTAIIGSGPIVIGQACEFDYSGTQACRVLREEGLRVSLVNSNPATIMTDPEFADATYVEPLLPGPVAQVIEKERPDALLPTLGGQTALNLARSLHEDGTLEKFGVELIGADYEAIGKAEDRDLFAQTMAAAGLAAAANLIVYSAIWGVLSAVAVRAGQAKGARQHRRKAPRAPPQSEGNDRNRPCRTR